MILATGTKSNPVACATFHGAAPKVHYVGDCCRAGDIHNAVYTGFGAASLI